MRIVDIREMAVPINSTIRNAVFYFSEMTASIVAVVTDVMRNGKPMVGFAFNSTGRYACGAQMRARFIPRVLRAKPEALLDEKGRLDPAKALTCMMQGENRVRIPIARSPLVRLKRPPGTPLQRSKTSRSIAYWRSASMAARALKSILLCRWRLVSAGPDDRRCARRDASPSLCGLHHDQDQGGWTAFG